MSEEEFSVKNDHYHQRDSIRGNDGVGRNDTVQDVAS